MWLWSLIPSKVKAFLAAAGTVIVALLFAFLKGKRAGKDAAAISTQRETQKINDRFHEIDNKPIDFGSAVERLRERSKPK